MAAEDAFDEQLSDHGGIDNEDDDHGDGDGRGGRGKSKSAKDLSHVPCKFYRVNACTAGAACPFSHNLTESGRPKDVCAWFIKGNCKFAHKCALAHVLPGQPMSMDRKNKKAAQQANGGGGGGWRRRWTRARGAWRPRRPQPSRRSRSRSCHRQRRERRGPAAPPGLAAPGLTKGLGAPPGLAAFGLGNAARPTAAAIVAGTVTKATTPPTQAPQNQNQPPQSQAQSGLSRTMSLNKDSMPLNTGAAGIALSVAAPTPGAQGTPRKVAMDYGFGPIGSPPRGSPAAGDGFPSSLGVPRSNLLRPQQGFNAWAGPGRGVDIQRGSAVDDDDLEEALPSSLNELLTDGERERRWSRTALGRPQIDAGNHRYSRSVPAQNWMDQVGGNGAGTAGSSLGSVVDRVIPGSSVSTAGGGPPTGMSLSPSNASGAFLGRPSIHSLAQRGGLAGAPNTGARSYDAFSQPQLAHSLGHGGLPSALGGGAAPLDEEYDERDRVGALSGGFGRGLASFAPGQSLPQGLAAGASRIHMLGERYSSGFSPGATSPSFGHFGHGLGTSPGGSTSDNWRTGAAGAGGNNILNDSALRSSGVAGTGRSVSGNGFNSGGAGANANASENWRTGMGDWARSPPGSLAGTGFASGIGGVAPSQQPQQQPPGLGAATGGMGAPPGLGVPRKSGLGQHGAIHSPLSRPVATNDQEDDDLFDFET
ncbi:hypothetical protein BKA62DRAFT_724380 [Auriculariales sp. MPI-PUGE-AT-0066]|nr:hypothetical protein BKA62DRAFT_724380 [Auriculariales sp. MPI-PUGE-AT-0066]